MYLKRLEINGFKSFAKKTELDFLSPITSIVGPNGSGKSNVAEAFRFVLGEQSIKSLRGKKGEDLIFNGSTEIPRANRASVKVVFDNSKRTFSIDFNEVSIERLVHRDGVNQYFINGSTARLKDITELLSQAHIGASGHHIISQGEADRILNAHPRERREMVEDALGLKMYQYKKQESLRKLEKTEENIASVESLRREIAPHIKFLQKQVEKIEKAVLLREELAKLYKEYFKREEIYLEYKSKSIAEQKTIPESELSRLEKELAESKKALSESSGSKTKQYEIIEIEGRLKSIRFSHEQMARDMGRIEGEIVSIKRAIDRKQKQAHIDEHKSVLLKDVEKVVSDIEVDIKDISSSSDFSIIKNIVKKIQEKLRSFVSTYRGDVSVSVTQEESEIAQLNTERQRIEKSLVETTAQEEKLNARYLTLKQDIEKEKDSSRDAERKVFIIMAEQNELRATLNILNEQSQRLELQMTDFKRELGEAGVLVGREILEYKNYKIDEDLAIKEDRVEQENRRRQIERMQIRLEDAGAGNSEEVLKEYRETSERDSFLIREINDLKKSAEDLQKLILELTARLDVEFKTGVLKINGQFSDFFRLMFGGGSASLDIVKEDKRRKKSDIEDIEMLNTEAEETESNLPEGLDISVQLPHKKTKGLMMLSGGERALTSIALLFAISQVNPPPFIILDETDAALDEANSRKYGDMIANLAQYSQLILITHNRETMSRAGVLYGVTMSSGGASKLLSIAFDDAVKIAK